MRARRRMRDAALLALATAWAAAGRGAAQDAPAGAPDNSEVQVLGQRRHTHWLTLDPITAALQTQMIYQSSSTSSTGTSSTFEQLLFQEMGSVTLSGGVLSKNFINYHLSVTGGLFQEFDQSPQSSQSSNGTIYGFDTGVSILPNSILPVDVYARRTENYVTRTFAPMMRDIVTEYGGSVDYRSDDIPTSLRAYHTETVQTGLGNLDQYITPSGNEGVSQIGISDASAYSLTQNNLELHSAAQPADRQALTLDYHYSSVDQTNPGLPASSFQNNTVDLTHVWGLDSASRYRLNSTLNYSDQSGSFPFKRLRIDEALNMQHTQNFSTYLDYTYDQQTYGSSTDTTHRVTGGFTHQLFRSLTTHGRVGYSIDNRSDGGATTDYFGGLTLDYTKAVPLGILSANAGLNHDQTDTGATGSTTQVIGQSQTFNDPLPIRLTAPGILPASIVVFSADGSRRLIEGLDYTVSRQRNAIELQRQLGGELADGESVLLNYEIGPLPGYNSTTDTYDLGGRYDFTQGPLTNLGVYARYLHQQQTIASAAPALLLPDNVDDLTVGADYRIGKLTLNAEQRTHDSSLTPYDSLHLGANYHDRFGERTTLSLSASQNWITYPQDNGSSDLTQVIGRLDYQIARHLKSQLQLTWRSQSDTRYGNISGYDVQSELRWDIRQTKIFLLGRYSTLSGDLGRSDNLMIELGMRRDF